jgi:hypothetical protein
VTVNAETPGADSLANAGDFMAEDAPPQFRGGILGTPAPTVPPAMRALVRLGVKALPALLDHLTDARPTGLTIDLDDNDPFGGMTAEELYDPRKRETPGNECFSGCDLQLWKSGHYTVKVGDLCYVLVGQIVDRDLFAVGYQPTAIVLIDSPVDHPSLAQRTRADWSGLTGEQHRASLLADLHDAKDLWNADPVLRRLRFYYPDAYTALTGKDATLRAQFEAGEKKAQAR